MPTKKTAKGAGAGKARPVAKPAPAKPAAAKAAPKAMKATKAPAPKPKQKTPPRPAPKPSAAGAASAAELQELKHRLAHAEDAASRVGALEAQIAELSRELAGATAERQTALERLADLEQRLAESAAAAPPPSRAAEIEQRLANALSEKATALRRARELEQSLDSLKANLDRERVAHAQTRSHAAAGEGAPAAPGPSAAEMQLQNRVGELETALAGREAELGKLLRRDAGELTCPRCGGKMVEFLHLGVTLDRCTECAGLFFDSGELQEVLRREYPEPSSSETTAATEAPAGDPGFNGTPRKMGFFRSLFGRKE